MKKRFYRLSKIVLAMAVLFAVLILTTCQHLSSAVQEPKISLHSMERTGININGVQMLAKVKVENPNSFKIPFPETDWTLFINANRFINGTVKNSQEIRARGSAIIEIPVNIDYVGIYNSFRSLIGTRQFRYKIGLGIKIPIPVFGERTWNLEHEGEIPLPQAPRLASPTIRLGDRNSTRAELVVSMNFENPNAFPVPAPKINYDYRINNNSFIRGTVDNQAPLAANTTSTISTRIQVTYTDLIRSFATLATASQVSSSFNFSCDFGLAQYGWTVLNSALPFTLPLR